MSLNCLSCQVQRSNSNGRDGGGHRQSHKPRARPSCADLIGRNWSGTLVPPDQIRGGCNRKVKKKTHRRLQSMESLDERRPLMQMGNCCEPKLLRSCGMRRDWSFEDLRQRKLEERLGGRKPN